jgi:hypothetical protein
MPYNRYARKVDSSQAEIVAALRKAGVRVWIISEPCDLLTLYRGVWLPLECKPAPQPGIRVKYRAIRTRYDQERQEEFMATTGTPRVRTAQEALQAVTAQQSRYGYLISDLKRCVPEA